VPNDSYLSLSSLLPEHSFFLPKQVYTAVAKIPTVQLLYSARPLALSMAFQRAHVKFFWVCLAFLVIFTQPGIFYSHLPPLLPAHRFRFRAVQARNGSPAKAPNVENLRILLNGASRHHVHTGDFIHIELL
jgi:hypothetical protein